MKAEEWAKKSQQRPVNTLIQTRGAVTMSLFKVILVIHLVYLFNIISTQKGCPCQ